MTNSADPDQFYTVCKGMAHPNSAGPGLILAYSADDNLIIFFFFFVFFVLFCFLCLFVFCFVLFFFQKKGFDILCKLSPYTTICIKCQSLCSRKNKKIL